MTPKTLPSPIPDKPEDKVPLEEAELIIVLMILKSVAAPVPELLVGGVIDVVIVVDPLNTPTILTLEVSVI